MDNSDISLNLLTLAYYLYLQYIPEESTIEEVHLRQAFFALADLTKPKTQLVPLWLSTFFVKTGLSHLKHAVNKKNSSFVSSNLKLLPTRSCIPRKLPR